MNQQPRPADGAPASADRTGNGRGLKALARKAFGRSVTSGASGASWSGRAPFGASSALAPAPGVAEDGPRQGAPDPEEIAAEGSRDQDTNQLTADPRPHSGGAALLLTIEDLQAVLAELSSQRDPDAPPLPIPQNRKRTTEKRTKEKKVRFTKTAVRVVEAAAARRSKKVAGFIADAALAEALRMPGTAASPEDDAARPLIETLESMRTELRRVGNNLNQIARAYNAGATPAHADTVLARVDHVVGRIHQAIDQLVAE